MTPYQIKRSILTAAIQGMLTVQDESEGTGVDLLVINAEEKKRRIALEKIKIGKPCKSISEDDILFDIPLNWTWARFGDLVLNFDSRRRPVTKEDRKTTKGLYDYFGATGAIDKVDEYIFDGEFLMIGEDGGNFFVDRDNSFIACGKFWANNHVHVVQPVVCEIYYLKHCLDAYNMPNMGLINGIAVPKLNQENMNSIMIPVPPLAEQKRIVAKIEELLPLIDRYEQAWSKLEDFNKRFPGDMQKSILQLAIQGKLVEQRPEEGTGEELFRQIQAEKQSLIKAGKIKKEKPIPEMVEDEFPFDIPDTWRWVAFGEISNIIGTGLVRSSSEQYVHAQYYYFKMNNIGNFDGQCHFENMNMINATEEEFRRYKIEQGDFLFNTRNSRELVGKTAVVPHIKLPIILNNNILKIQFFAGILPEYINCFFNSPLGRMQITRFITNTTNVAAIYQRQLVTLLIPLPPVAEQKRIVAKLEEILPLCERLK